VPLSTTRPRGTPLLLTRTIHEFHVRGVDAPANVGCRRHLAVARRRVTCVLACASGSGAVGATHRSERRADRSVGDEASNRRSCAASVNAYRPTSRLVVMLVSPPAAKIIAMMTNWYSAA